MTKDRPTVLGFHLEYRGAGRAAAAADRWKRASSFLVLPFEQVVNEKQSPPTSVTVFSLSADTAYCFRVRARSVGGWGPRSSVSEAYRTKSYVAVQDQFSTAHAVVARGKVHEIVGFMESHAEIRPVQTICVEALAKIALTRTLSIYGIAMRGMGRNSHVWITGGPRTSSQLDWKPEQHLPLVVKVCTAMRRFKLDFQLQQHGCMLFGRLAASDGQFILDLFTAPMALLTCICVVQKPGGRSWRPLGPCARIWRRSQTHLSKRTTQRTHMPSGPCSSSGRHSLPARSSVQRLRPDESRGFSVRERPETPQSR